MRSHWIGCACHVPVPQDNAASHHNTKQTAQRASQGRQHVFKCLQECTNALHELLRPCPRPGLDRRDHYRYVDNSTECVEGFVGIEQTYVEKRRIYRLDYDGGLVSDNCRRASRPPSLLHTQVLIWFASLTPALPFNQYLSLYCPALVG